MTRGGNRCKHRPVRYEFMEALIAFAYQHKGSTPTHDGWWKLVRQQGYTLSWTSFRQHTFKLADEGLIVFVDGVICIRHGRYRYTGLDGVVHESTGAALDSPRAQEELAEMRAAAKARRSVTNAKQSAGSGGGSLISSTDIPRMLELQKHRCWWCGKELTDDYHLDHRVPVSRGGTSDAGNICISCPTCNLKKGDRMPWEFNGRLV